VASEKEWADALYRGITGGLSSAVEARTLPTRLAGIERRFGSAKKASEALGVSVGTYRRWLSGKQKPNAANAKKVLSAERRARLSPGREARLRKGQPVTTKKSTVNYKMIIECRTRSSGESERDRILPVGAYIPQDHMGAIVTTWLMGDDTKAVALLQSAIAIYYAEDILIGSIHKIGFGSPSNTR
jgi:transcriptional regulator with XRE-family HTH domain